MIKFDMSSHICKACVICCMDFRIYKENTLDNYLKSIGIETYDLIAIPGAGKQLLGNHRDLIIDAIKISMSLHKSREIIIIHHADCGAYGGSKAFVSKESELGKHRYEMETARQVINEKLATTMPVRLIFFDESNGELKPTIL